ncbi:WbqC family protein [Ramlibacter sp. AN1133]|uniref:WbqC family protein n=1 Tax=Ramlibacter sp. AN1133 TaxID=3133429 RepID=UPI0030C461E6
MNDIRTAAIHQPNFFPWLGYFNKIARADVFIVMDDVQYQKTGSSWSNRVQLPVAGQGKWVTAPIRRPAHGVQTLAQIEWDAQPWREKLARTLHLHYARAPHYAEAMSLLEPLVRNPEPRLLPYNLHAVRTIAAALGLGGRFVLASAFAAQATGTQRLVELVRAAGCRRYLAGGGAGGYQEDALFAAAGLELEYQAYTHPAYPQHGATGFVPGMSIIDVLMNCGVVRTRELVTS